MTRRYLSTEVAVLLSLLFHALLFGSWQYRHVLGQLPLFRQLASVYTTPIRRSEPPVTPTITFVQTPARESEPPRTFMETDDTQVTGEQPKNAQYYSDRSTVAANPTNPTGKEGDTPYLEGTETRMMSTETVSPQPGVGESPSPPAMPAAAAPPSPPAAPPSPAQHDLEQAKPPGSQTVDESKTLPAEGLKVVEETKVAALTPPSAPVVEQRTTPSAPEPSVAPSRAASPGSSSNREIGARKSALKATGISRYGIAAFNVEESPFGAYDKGIIRAVQSRWYALIDQNSLYERSGQVTLHFNLMPDGSIEGMKTEDNSAGEILALFCEKAIVDSAPFDPLPDKLRTLIGNEPREVNFTFYY
ncbi:MAG TPA: hypothetical protein VLZ12_07135 [Verrucomicrobiae bacterium]|nr:hypothetical protein [Verrucomicrobiae bacterium]